METFVYSTNSVVDALQFDLQAEDEIQVVSSHGVKH